MTSGQVWKSLPARQAGWPAINTDPAKYQAVTAEDIRRVAALYLTPENRTVALYYTKEPDPGKAPPDPALASLSDEDRKQVEGLRAALEKAEPVVLTEGEAKVKFVHLTEKLSGPAFRNNRITGTHILRKDGGVWKVFSTIQDSVDYLDKTS